MQFVDSIYVMHTHVANIECALKIKMKLFSIFQGLFLINGIFDVTPVYATCHQNLVINLLKHKVSRNMFIENSQAINNMYKLNIDQTTLE